MRGVYLLLTVILISCKQSYEVHGIVVSESLAAHTYDKEYDYKELLLASINGDKASIRQFSTLPTNDGTGYEHGAVLVDLVELIGEGQYIEALGSLKKQDKRVIASFLEVGLEYGNNPRLKNQRLENIFPELSRFIKE